VYFEVQFLHVDRCTVEANFRLFFYTWSMRSQSKSHWYF